MIKYINAFLSFLLFLSCTTDGLKVYDPEIIGPPSFTVSVTAGNGGSVSTAGGEYEEGSELTITATPSSGYIFSGWSNGSVNNPITITVNSDTTLHATFSAIPSYNVTLTANSGGSVTGGGLFRGNPSYNICNTCLGYVFSSWSDGSNDSTRTFTILENITLTAIL